ncbi:MAG: Transcriptional regulator, LuxR family [Burkholderiaceae bacterium]|jgi:transcriptional regulator EpsA|nr:MAG: Transcriptional regulator, LuxR family [Burkholderiaceae bacterium]
MEFPSPRPDEDSARLLKLVCESVSIERHIDLLRWLQGDVQRYLPHDVLLAGWGDFEQGAVQHDILSELPGVRSYGIGAESLPFLLGKFHDHWTGSQRKPLLLPFREFEYLLGSDSLPGSLCGTLRTMRSVLICGIGDERGGFDCLYALMRHEQIPVACTGNALTVLLPHIDTALRQVKHLPQQSRRRPPVQPVIPEDAFGLSEREAEIMAWVAMGKTNSEIGTILNISGFTVKNHMQRIFRKLNVYSRAQAVSKVVSVAADG